MSVLEHHYDCEPGMCVPGCEWRAEEERAMSWNDDRPMDEQASLPFFFYGTLRPGHGNSRALPDDAEFHPATMSRARIHYVSGRGGYPVLIDTDADTDVVVGDLVWLDVTHPAVQRVSNMERGAGYDLRPRLVEVDYGQPEGSKTVGALVWVYPPSRPRGELIPGGDWNEVA